MLFEETPVGDFIAVTDARNSASIRLLGRVSMVLTNAAEAVFRGEACVAHTYRLPRASKQGRSDA
ncbi:MAG: hypothetical protein JNM76_18775 [Betaproteobacteria bacterium]|nr:hypothetical protein [Betaproteobacteria bacterium]